MAAFVSVTWTTGDIITEAKMDNMVSNDQSEDAHESNGIQLANNVSYKAKQAGGTVKDLIKLGTDDVMRLSQIRYDDDGTPGTKEDIIIQTGWGQINGDGVNRTLTEAVTFPTAYTVPLGVVVTFIGTKASSDAADVTELTGTSGGNKSDADSIATTGFNARISRVSNDGADPGVFASGTRIGYSWIAWGTKA